MKAYIKIDNSSQKELGKFLAIDSEKIFVEYLSHSKTIDETKFDLDNIYTKGQKIKLNNFIGIVSDDAEIKYKEEPRIIYSYEPFKYIVNVIKEFDSKLFEDIQDNPITSVVESDNISSVVTYKNIFYCIFNINANLVGDIIGILGKYMTHYGFVRNVQINDRMANKCNIFDLFFNFYLIYETFYLFEKLNDTTNELTLSIFDLLYERKSEKDIIVKINDNLSYLESINSFTYHSEFDEENVLWKTDLLFNNSLSLVIYELKMQLSKNVDISFSICKNPECLKTMTVFHKSQKYCSDNDECKRTYNNQRKKKERDKKRLSN